MKKVILQGRNICKVFPRGKVKNNVLNNIDVDIYEKDFTIIMGASGAGKSTLMYALSGMDSVTGGSVVYRGKDICRLSEKEMADIRARKFGFVFQQSHLVSNLTLLENVNAMQGRNPKTQGQPSGNCHPVVFNLHFPVHRSHRISWRRQLHTSGDTAGRVWKPYCMGVRCAGYGYAYRQHRDTGWDRKN